VGPTELAGIGDYAMFGWNPGILGTGASEDFGSGTLGQGCRKCAVGLKVRVSVLAMIGGHV